MPEKENVNPNNDVTSALRALIDGFIHERLQIKLDKLGDGEDDKRQRLLEEHRREAWIADAARRVRQIQLASHTLKPIHPDARGTNVYMRESLCTERALVGTHSLTDGRTDDVVGNAAALDVYKFLKLSHDGKTLSDRTLDNDPALIAALSDEPGQARSWAKAFAGIAESKVASASHTLAKQLYFPMPDGGYHLLAPLFPTTLVHRLHATLEADRFSDAAREARKARQEGKSWPNGYREYPNLAVQNFGGSKPQNISQLNSERGGLNHLLPSLPPMWRSGSVKPPLRHQSVFENDGAIGVLHEVQDLRKRLARNESNIHGRSVDTVEDIVANVLDLVAQIRALPAGWSTADECSLDAVERRWLDPGAVAEPGDAVSADSNGAPRTPPDWRDEIARRFANWLNAIVGTDRTSIGNRKQGEWNKLLEGAVQRLREDLADDKPEDCGAVVVLPRLRVQNANAVSSPFTWGFPAPSAFTGFVHALQRRLNTSGRDLCLEGVAIICHDFEPQVTRTSSRRAQVFRLARHPLDKDGCTSAIVEEGRVHLEVSLVIKVSGDGCPLNETDGKALSVEILSIAEGLRLAGGSILPHPERGRHPPEWVGWPGDHETRLRQFRMLRRRLLPGFALVSREPLLAHHLDILHQSSPHATPLDALLDLCRLNIEPEMLEGSDGKVAWSVRRPYRGWLVPLPVGYAAISQLYAPGEVKDTRDSNVPFRFVESVLSLGEWISLHRVSQLEQLFWHHHAQPDAGLYRLHNPYFAPEPSDPIA
ncbi:type I-F CRISPR-associated protein Csy1 (plasmid) [Paraburkholderia sp. DD10]|uniref:type I-F CRISPR-associated protein Csy1 n=1 Tax=Paraburkholderia sp. DD10 TaxID=3409691 RepID=UPI003BA0C3C4